MQALRFWAAFVVVVEHATFYVHERLDSTVEVWEFGRLGVFVFFVISGFVMQLSVQRRPSAGAFAMRRIVRIVPLYWIATTTKLLALVFAPALVLHAALSPLTVGLSYVFLPTTNGDGMAQPLLGVGWTLVFEAGFYAVVTLALALRLSPFWVAFTLFAALSIAHPFRGSVFPAGFVYFDPIVLFFISGMALARWVTCRRTAELVLVHVFILAVWVGAWTGAAPAGQPATPRVLGAVAVVVLVAAVVFTEPFAAKIIPRWMRFLGDASYSIYLAHSLVAPVVPMLFAHQQWTSAAQVDLAVVLCVVVGVTSGLVTYIALERPITAAFLRRDTAGSRMRPGVGRMGWSSVCREPVSSDQVD